MVGGGCFSDYSVSFGPKSKSLENVYSISFQKFPVVGGWWVVGGGCFSHYSVSLGPKSKSLELEKCLEMN